MARGNEGATQCGRVLLLISIDVRCVSRRRPKRGMVGAMRLCGVALRRRLPDKVRARWLKGDVGEFRT